jgi:hypothetical protein
MKNIITLLVALIAVSAQAQIIREGTADYNKAPRAAIIAEIDHVIDVVEWGLNEDMKTRGFGRGDNDKGYIAFENIKFPQLSAANIDLYFKIEEKPKDKQKTVLTMLISKGNDNFMSGVTDAAVFTAAREYIKGLMPIFNNRKLDLNIEATKQSLKDQEKELKDAEDKIKDLEKKKKDLEKELSEAQKALEEQKGKVQTTKQSLETLKGQKK